MIRSRVSSFSTVNTPYLRNFHLLKSSGLWRPSPAPAPGGAGRGSGRSQGLAAVQTEGTRSRKPLSKAHADEEVLAPRVERRRAGTLRVPRVSTPGNGCGLPAGRQARCPHPPHSGPISHPGPAGAGPSRRLTRPPRAGPADLDPR